MLHRAAISALHARQATNGVDAPKASAKDGRSARMDRSEREMLVRATRSMVLHTRRR
jgi:hypothetical protein